MRRKVGETPNGAHPQLRAQPDAYHRQDQQDDLEEVAVGVYAGGGNGRRMWEGAFSSMLDSHFISKSDSLLSDNNFERFLSERQENLHKQIKAKTTPPSK